MDKQEAKNGITYSVQYILSSDVVLLQNGETRMRKKEDSRSTSDPTQSEAPSGHTETTGSGTHKKMRQTFTGDQLKKLEESFLQTKYPTPVERYELATVLKLPETTVKVWFQNRRMKLKRNYWEARNYARNMYYRTAASVPYSLPYSVNNPERYNERKKCPCCPALMMTSRYQGGHPVAYDPASSRQQQNQAIPYSLRGDYNTSPPYYDHRQMYGWNLPWGYNPVNDYRSGYPRTNTTRVDESNTVHEAHYSSSYEKRFPSTSTDDQEAEFQMHQRNEELSRSGSEESRGQTSDETDVGFCRANPIIIQ